MTIDEWLDSLPPPIAEVARKYPTGTKLVVYGEWAWVVSYQEMLDQDDGSRQAWLAVSYIDPYEDIQGAHDNCFIVCPCCFENNLKGHGGLK